MWRNFPRAYPRTSMRHRALGSRMISAHALILGPPSQCLIDRIVSDATLNAVFQGLSTKLSSVSEERNILLSELIALQDNFNQEQCVTTVLGPVSRKSRNFSGDVILFVSSKRRLLEARNFAGIFIFIPFTTYENTSFTQ